jgi:short-subunit dehydrogenase
MYIATKYAVESLTDALRMEASKFNVDVIAIQPGFIKSNFQDTAWDTQAKTIADAKSTNQYGVESQVLTHYELGIQKATKLMNQLPWAQVCIINITQYFTLCMQ